jgi:hypothetical protein
MKPNVFYDLKNIYAHKKSFLSRFLNNEQACKRSQISKCTPLVVYEYVSEARDARKALRLWARSKKIIDGK